MIEKKIFFEPEFNYDKKSQNIIDIENDYDRIKEIENKKKARLQQMKEYSRNKRMSTIITSRENDSRRYIYHNSPEKADQIKARIRESYQNSPEKADFMIPRLHTVQRVHSSV